MLQNGPLISALEALGIALEVLFSAHFAGVCNELIEVLRGHSRPLKLTDVGFLNHTVERVLVKFFRTISKEEEVRDVPGCDITNPAGCASPLKTMLADMVRELVDVAKATILEKCYTVSIRLRKERVTPTTPTDKTRQKTSPQEGAGVAGEQCGQLIKAIKKSGTPLKCAKGKDCKYKHGKLSDLTKKSARDLIIAMPIWMQECLSPLVTTCKGLKQ